MIEVLRTNDLVRLSWAQAMLEAEGIAHIVVDQHMSSMEGGINALQRRILVLDDDAHEALQVLDEAERALGDAGPA